MEELNKILEITNESGHSSDHSPSYLVQEAAVLTTVPLVTKF